MWSMNTVRVGNCYIHRTRIVEPWVLSSSCTGHRGSFTLELQKARGFDLPPAKRAKAKIVTFISQLFLCSYITQYSMIFNIDYDDNDNYSYCSNLVRISGNQT